MAKRRMLLIGTGNWGAVHLEALTADRHWQIAALADASPETLARSARQAGVDESDCYLDPHEALRVAKYDAVTIVVRPPFRQPILLDALRAGVPLLMEKPVVYTADELREVRAAAAQHKARVMVVQNHRFDPQARRLAELIQARRTWGRLHAITIEIARSVLSLGDHYIRNLDGGTGLGMEIAIHTADTLRFLLNDEAVRVQAQGFRSVDSRMVGWDTLQAWIDFHDDVRVNFRATVDTATDRTRPAGRWTFDFSGGSLTWSPLTTGKDAIHFHTPWTDESWSPVASRRSAFRHASSRFVPLALQEFTTALDEGREFETSLQDNEQSLALAMAMVRSAEEEHPVRMAAFQNEIGARR